MTNNQSLSNRDAIATLRFLDTLDDDSLDIHHTTRTLLIDIDSDEHDDFSPFAPMIRLAIISLDDDNLSLLRLEYSLCPMHACDYAICFDDDTAECASIRLTFPSHDT